MKRLLTALIAVLLLTGCAADNPNTDGSNPESTSAPDVSTGVSMEEASRIKAETGGLIDAYVLPTMDYTGISFFNGRIALFAQSGDLTTLSLVSPETAAITASVTLRCTVAPGSTQIRLGNQRIAYFDSASHSIIFLDSSLREAGRAELPEDIQGDPVISEDMNRIYYCTAEDIRVLDLQTGISRLLKQHHCAAQSLSALCFEESILVCAITDDRGEKSTAYISTENGATVLEESGHQPITSLGDSYFAPRINGTVQELLFGVLGRETQNLTPIQSLLSTQPVLELSGAVGFPEKDGIYGMDFYDLTTGKRTASVTLPSMVFPGQVAGQPGSSRLWFLAHDQQTQENLLCSWDLSASALSDDTQYATVRYTSDAPDEAGLAQVEERAQALGDTYGVDIRIWQDAVKTDCGYSLEAEFQVNAILRELSVLEGALSRFPEGFFSQLAEITSDGEIHICLVRSLEGAVGSLAGAQAWCGTESYIYLAAGTGLEQSFYHQLSHAIDSRVLVETTHFDDWNNFNPDGFSYDSRYDISLGNAEVCPYPEYFIDTYSMASAQDDRASIFEYAMMPDSGYVFAAEPLQAKLLQLCKGIRKAFDLKDYPSALPWEAHLNESLVPQT